MLRSLSATAPSNNASSSVLPTQAKHDAQSEATPAIIGITISGITPKDRKIKKRRTPRKTGSRDTEEYDLSHRGPVHRVMRFHADYPRVISLLKGPASRISVGRDNVNGAKKKRSYHHSIRSVLSRSGPEKNKSSVSTKADNAAAAETYRSLIMSPTMIPAA